MIWTSKCGKPMIKFGIYRPGNEKQILETSILDYDYIKIKEIKNQYVIKLIPTMFYSLVNHFNVSLFLKAI